MTNWIIQALRARKNAKLGCLGFFFLVCTPIFTSQAFANVGETFGFGSRTAALGGAGVAWGTGSFAAYYNPAALALPSEKRLLLDWGLVAMRPHFRPIQNIVTQNNYNSDSQSNGNVDQNYKDTFGQSLGLSYRLLPGFGNLTVGIVTFMPIDQTAYMDTGESYIPEYILYRSRTQRPQVEVGLGLDLGHGFYFGGGLHTAFSLTSNASIFINANKNGTSSMRFIASLKPKLAPYFGLLYAPGEKEQKPLSLGAVLRLPVASDNSMNVNTGVSLLGNLSALDINFNATSALYYDPMALELGASWQHSSRARLYGQLEYQVWRLYQTPALVIDQPQSTVVISPGSVPSPNYVNILVPRVGEELNLSEFVTVRLGYAYRPSIMSGLPTDVGNFLDPPKHMLNVGLGLNYESFLGFATPSRLDFHFSYQYLLVQHVVKTPGNEIGAMTDSKIGAPGYDAGGYLVGGGATLSLAL